VAATSWTVWLPKDAILTGTGGNATPVEEDPTWVRRAIDRFLPSLRREQPRRVRSAGAIFGERARRTADGDARRAAASDEPVVEHARGTPVRFVRGAGDARVRVSFASPAVAGVRRVLLFLAGVVIGVGWPRWRRVRVAPATACASVLGVSIVMLAMVGPGGSFSFSALFWGGVAASLWWVVAGLVTGVRRSIERRRAARAEAAASAPETVEIVETEETEETGEAGEASGEDAR
jgi:hypothetical protein